MLAGGDIFGASSTTGELVRQRRVMWGSLRSTIQALKKRDMSNGVEKQSMVCVGRVESSRWESAR